jgi:predicted NBD/HSP70 family sugar kinase
MGSTDKMLFYKKLAIKHLYFSGVLSSTELSDLIKKSIPHTNKIIEELTDDEWVAETGYGPSSGGRRPSLYAIRPSMLYILSVAMDQFVTRIVLMDMQNKYVTPVEKFELPLSKNPEALVYLTQKIQEFIEKCGVDRNKIAGIGIGMPGFVNPKEGLNYTHLGNVGGESIVKYISRRVHMPVFIDNDSSLIALAELKFGGAVNKKNVMVVNVGWGIGLGLVLDGKLFRGNNGFAGEFSHIPLFLNNKLCGCGKSGCLETETSLSILVEKARTGLQAGHLSSLDNGKLLAHDLEVGFEAMVDATRKGDKFCINLISEAAYHIGRGIAILIHLLNPETIILSGRGSLLGNILEVPVLQALNEHCIPRLGVHTKLQVSSLGYDAELIGAAALVMENFEKGAHGDLFQAKQHAV